MHRSFSLGALLALAVLAGCGEDVAKQVQQTATHVGQQVTKAVDGAQTTAKEQLNLAGKSELTLDARVTTPACYAIFTPATDGRSSVLALQSYKTSENEVFPSFYIQATVTPVTLAELAGQTVPAQMFVKTTADGPTWHTPADAPVQFKIVSIADKQVTAELTGGALARTDGQGTMNASGKFTAVLP